MNPPDDSAREVLERLSRELDALRARVERLESGAPASDAVDEAPDAVEPSPVAAPAAAGPGVVALAGRTLLELGGAFVLRAMTDAGTVTHVTGTTLGLAFAAGLLGMAERDGRRGASASANFHAFTSMLVAFPLIAEATTRLQVFPATLAATLVVAFLAADLMVAWRHVLVPAGWLATMFAAGTTLVLLRGTGNVPPFVVAMLCTAAATEILAFDDRWTGPRWIPALCSNLLMIFVAVLAVRPGGVPAGYVPFTPAFAVGAELALVALYIASIGTRTVVRGRVVRAFAMLQGPAAALVGLTCAARILAAHGGSTAWAGLLALALAAAAYAVAFVYAMPPDRTRNFLFHTSLGALLLFVGLGWLLDGDALGVVQAAIGIAALAAGVRARRVILELQGALLVGAGALLTGLLSTAAKGLVVAVGASWPATTAAALATLSALIVCFALVTSSRPPGAAPAGRVAVQLALAALAFLGIAGTASLVLVPALAGGDAAFASATRTALLSAGAVGLAALARRPRMTELRWLVPVVLAGCGLKVLLEDLPHGRPASQVITLAVYGAALFVTPRLLRRQND